MAYYVYILANRTHTTLYIGVTNDLLRRVYEHRAEVVPGFTARYHVDRLVYYEVFGSAYEAISREKALKGWRRSRKNELVERENPTWRDLYPELIGAAEETRETDSSLRSE